MKFSDFYQYILLNIQTFDLSDLMVFSVFAVIAITNNNYKIKKAARRIKKWKPIPLEI